MITKKIPAAQKDRCILVTGFMPFGGERTNPSWEIARLLPKIISGHRLVSLRVPTEFGKAISVTTKAINAHQPEIVLCFGQAGGRSCMNVERVAINVDDTRTPDNAGRQLSDEAIRADGPTAYFCTVPIKAMVAAMIKVGVPAKISNTAGTFVCNHLIYGVLHHIAQYRLTTRAGFIHVPYLESQVLDKADTAAMALATMITGAEAAIMASIKYQTRMK